MVLTDFLGDSIIIVTVTSYSTERSFSDLKRIKTAVNHTEQLTKLDYLFYTYTVTFE